MSEIPSCYAQAINSPDSTSWKRAMDEEIHSLESSDTYELTALLHNPEVVGGKWVYTIKSGPNIRKNILRKIMPSCKLKI